MVLERNFVEYLVEYQVVLRGIFGIFRIFRGSASNEYRAARGSAEQQIGLQQIPRSALFVLRVTGNIAPATDR